jgi:hypothetical protein
MSMEEGMKVVKKRKSLFKMKILHFKFSIGIGPYTRVTINMKLHVFSGIKSVILEGKNSQPTNRNVTNFRM